MLFETIAVAPDAADPLMRWAEFVEKTEWKSHAELKVLSETAYDWECEVEPHPWRVKPSLIAAIKVAFRQKGYKQKEAAKAIGVSTTALSDILHGRRAINFDVARNIYHNLGVPANVVLG